MEDQVPKVDEVIVTDALQSEPTPAVEEVVAANATQVAPVVTESAPIDSSLPKMTKIVFETNGSTQPKDASLFLELDRDGSTYQVKCGSGLLICGMNDTTYYLGVQGDPLGILSYLTSQLQQGDKTFIGTLIFHALKGAISTSDEETLPDLARLISDLFQLTTDKYERL